MVSAGRGSTSLQPTHWIWRVVPKGRRIRAGLLKTFCEAGLSVLGTVGFDQRFIGWKGRPELG